MSSSPPAESRCSPTRTVAAWHEALNSGDVERLVALSHPGIEVGGPRGSSSGARILREWMDRAKVRIEPGRTFNEAGAVVVEQDVEWRSAAPGEHQTAASVFVVEEGLVKSVVRYPDLASALRAADLDESFERGPG